MPTSNLDSLAEGRAARTGESHQQARMALRRIGRRVPPIPDAEIDDQASLEAQFLTRLGRCRHHHYWSPKPAFMVSSVTPDPDGITIRVPDEYLPDAIRDVFPYWWTEDDGSQSEVQGIPGLRYVHEHGQAILTRIGKPGRVCIPAGEGVWEKACRVAVDSLAEELEFFHPWRTSPAEWHPDEDQPWFPEDDSDCGNNRFASQILRRLPGLCPSTGAEWHDLWITWSGSRCNINLEWMNGASHAEVLKLLLADPGSDQGQR
jgi:hypothetical protein